jgi:hypothetical protein
MALKRTPRRVMSPDDLMVYGPMPMPSRARFFQKMVRSVGIAVGVIGSGLLIGMIGYHAIGELSWQEAFYYSSMILSGEGPPPDPQRLTATSLSHLHLFAGFYALFSGVTFITMVGVLFAPALHRFLHRFHLEIAGHDENTTDEG